MARSLNRVQLIGNLTRDPELRYTPTGQAVCSFSIATNRSWTTDTGEKKEEADYHNIIAWGKLGELCSQYLKKGRKAYVEGRLATRNWESKEGQQKTRTEVIINDMIILDGQGGRKEEGEATTVAPKLKAKKEESSETAVAEEVISPDDIPF